MHGAMVRARWLSPARDDGDGDGTPTPTGGHRASRRIGVGMMNDAGGCTVAARSCSCVCVRV